MKIFGKSKRNQLIYVNHDVTRDLLWFADTFKSWTSIHMLHTHTWGPHNATLSLYCDTSLTGLGFWCPTYCVAFVANIPSTAPNTNTFWYEVLMVLAALHWASTLPLPLHHLTIFPDSLNTVQIFNSLRASFAAYNLILLSIIHVLLLTPRIDLQVFHITGDQNYIVNVISQHMSDVALQHILNLSIIPFEPPQDALGATPQC